MTTYDVVMQTANVVTAIGGLAWVYVALITYRGQMNAQVFVDCNNRYDDIVASFPPEAWGARLKLSELPPPSHQVTLCALRYLNLGSEEFYLYKRGYINRAVWDIWEGELRRTLRSQLFKREWQVLRDEFDSYPEFIQYVETVQREAA